jgi:GH43 family beta-xylosidase
MPPAEYQNPLSRMNFPDPAAIRFRGRYYAYATGEAPDGRIFPIMTSPDAIHWTFHAGAMAPLSGPSAVEYWAPEVAYRNGAFYLYYAVIAFGTPEHHLRVAVSESPLGPFEDQGSNLTPGEIFAIDAHPFQDDDGQWYLFYARDWLEPPYIGTGTVVDRLVTMTQLSGRPARVLRPYAEWQLFERQRAEKGGVDWYTVEGPFTLKRRGKYVCLYSGGCWKHPEYGVAYAISDVPMGAGGLEDQSYQDTDNRNGPRVLTTRPGEVLGPGHNSVVKGPNNVADLIVYHGWPPDLSGRLLRVDRMEWHAGKPYCAGPTLTPQPVPAAPSFRSRFADIQGSRLDEAWGGEPGEALDNTRWLLRNGEAVTQGGTTLLRYWPRENYLFEANLRIQGVPTEGGAGVLAAEVDGKERLVVMIEPEQIALRSRAGTAVRAALPSDFRHDVYHQILIERNAGRVRVRLDGLAMLEGDYPPGPAHVGLHSEMATAYDGITVTEHFFDDFRSGEARGWWAGQHSHWAVRDGALVQPESGPGRHEIAKGEALWAWELEVDVQPLSGGGSCGVLVRFASEGQTLEAALVGSGRQADDRGQTTGVWSCRLGDEERPLPAGFDPSREHHLRLERSWEDRLTLWVEGNEIVSIPVPADNSRIALFTDGAAAAFRDVSFTGLGH